MRSLLAAILVVTAIFSYCDCQNQFVPIPINTPTSGRIMNIAANYIGVTLVREISAYQMVNRPIYRVNFEARSSFGTCQYDSDFVPIGIGSFTSGRVMTAAANHIGVSLYKEISASKKRTANVYRVTFLGKQKSGYIIRCNAEVDETKSIPGKVTKYACVA